MIHRYHNPLNRLGDCRRSGSSALSSTDYVTSSMSPSPYNPPPSCPSTPRSDAPSDSSLYSHSSLGNGPTLYNHLSSRNYSTLDKKSTLYHNSSPPHTCSQPTHDSTLNLDLRVASIFNSLLQKHPPPKRTSLLRDQSANVSRNSHQVSSNSSERSANSPPRNPQSLEPTPPPSSHLSPKTPKWLLKLPSSSINTPLHLNQHTSSSSPKISHNSSPQPQSNPKHPSPDFPASPTHVPNLYKMSPTNKVFELLEQSLTKTPRPTNSPSHHPHQSPEFGPWPLNLVHDSFAASPHMSTPKPESIQESSDLYRHNFPNVSHNDIKDAVSIALGSNSCEPAAPTPLVADPAPSTHCVRAQFDIASQRRFDQARLERFLENARRQHLVDETLRARESSAYDWAAWPAALHHPHNASRASSLRSAITSFWKKYFRRPGQPRIEYRWWLMDSSQSLPQPMPPIASSLKDPLDVLRSCTLDELTTFQRHFTRLQLDRWRLVGIHSLPHKPNWLLLSRVQATGTNYVLRGTVVGAAIGILFVVARHGNHSEKDTHV